MKLSERIRAVRGQMGQVKFAEKIGSSQSSVSAYEKGQRKPDYEVLVRIAKEFDISLNWLLTGEESALPQAPQVQRSSNRISYDGIGERIRKIRGTNTQTEFARCIGVTQRTVVNYETLDRVPKNEVIEKICEQFRVSKEWLLSGNGPMNATNEPQSASLGSGSVSFVMPDMSGNLGQKFPEVFEFVDAAKKNTPDASGISFNNMMSRCLQLSEEYSKSVKQNGDLRVEVERLRMELERRNRRIEELEKAYNEEHKELMLLKKTLSPTSPQPVQPVTEKELQH